MGIAKWAVDSAAKEYWSNYYKEYGKSWVRDIPRRVKKAMSEQYKKANINFEGSTIAPIATAMLDNGGVALEGIVNLADNNQFMFAAEFDGDGVVTSFSTAKLQLAK